MKSEGGRSNGTRHYASKLLLLAGLELLPLPLGAGGAGGDGGSGPEPALEEHGPDVIKHWFVPFWMRMKPDSPHDAAHEFLMIQYGGLFVLSKPTASTP